MLNRVWMYHNHGSADAATEAAASFSRVHPRTAFLGIHQINSILLSDRTFGVGTMQGMKLLRRLSFLMGVAPGLILPIISDVVNAGALHVDDVSGEALPFGCCIFLHKALLAAQLLKLHARPRHIQRRAHRARMMKIKLTSYLADVGVVPGYQAVLGGQFGQEVGEPFGIAVREEVFGCPLGARRVLMRQVRAEGSTARTRIFLKRYEIVFLLAHVVHFIKVL
mmetsp:Transcript_57732/g.122815  ORF Transcript_57732/g.122815 Transcript_57732/m.122815 type:complete len:223 (+) Transcript_57732:1958-2626(+)